MKTELRERILQTAKDMMPLFVEVREFIYYHAELGNQEFVSSQYLVDQMKKLGFTVTYPYCDLATAFRAELVLGEGPKVCFMAEYDALPGYGPAKDQVRHACGHNWIAASTLGAAAVLASLKDTLSGTGPAVQHKIPVLFLLKIGIKKGVERGLWYGHLHLTPPPLPGGL